MAGEQARHVVMMGLEVTDAVAYGRYRSAMAPILATYGGSFGCDFLVAAVLEGDPRINRVFALSFPDRAARERFLADESYRAVRAELFEPAVGRVVRLAETA
jgi:uncharacterized protein (DUF1330 family)